MTEWTREEAFVVVFFVIQLLVHLRRVVARAYVLVTGERLCNPTVATGIERMQVVVAGSYLTDSNLLTSLVTGAVQTRGEDPSPVDSPYLVSCGYITENRLHHPGCFNYNRADGYPMKLMM